MDFATNKSKHPSRFVRLTSCCTFVAGFCALSSSAQTAPTKPAAPQTIFFHGNILTGAHLTSDNTSATPATVSAIAVSNGLIEAVGSDPDILKLKSAHTQLIDLHGAFAMPGFNDAHTHMAYAGQQRLTLDLDGTTSLADMLARIKAYAATLPPRAWITGGGWDHTKWVLAKLPMRQDLDSVTGNHPALLSRVDGHIAIANTAALHAANITAQSPDPVGGKFDHDGTGELTGIVRETPARILITAHIPPPDATTRRKALELSIADALSHGVTSVQDFSDWDDWLVLADMERHGQLHLRFAEWIDFNLPLDVLEQHRTSHDADDPLLHLTQLKGFMDGSLGSRTAAMDAPYTDDPGNTGISRFDADKLNQMAAERAAAGFQMGFHAIGDHANEMALDAFAAAESSGTPVGFPAPVTQTAGGMKIRAMHRLAPPLFRYRIEHAQVVGPDDFVRFHDLGIIASMQPSHLLTDMVWAGARIGPERQKYAYAWRSFLDAGVTLAFGTDYPVESISPFRGLYSAITRQNEAGTQTFEPQEKLNINEALYAYTQASAFAEFREHIKGLLEPGFVADIIVLDRDITHASPQDVLHTNVLRTIVGGKTMYEATAGKIETEAREPRSKPADGEE